MVTVTVPSLFGWTMNGPASVVPVLFPFAGLVYVMWNATVCVTSRPSEKTVSRYVPTVCRTNGKGQNPTGRVRVRSMWVSVVTG